ncbi:MAG: hypothetical protein FWG88_01545 [Oscillospiraceae bacterium]|nr:hypothetical protein [Oscillospiraceae bacterium]
MGKNRNIMLNAIIVLTLALVLLVSLRSPYVSSIEADEDMDIDLHTDMTIESFEPFDDIPEESDDLPIESEEPTIPQRPIRDTPIVPEIFANEITELMEASVLDGNFEYESLDVVFDGDYETNLLIEAGGTISISSPETIYSLYFIWDMPAETYYLSSSSPEIDGQPQVGGAYGFLHEFIAIEEPNNEIILSFPSDAILCDIYAFGEGTPPEWVQEWNPPLSEADMLMIPTHGKDEYLCFLGVLPYYAGMLGYKVQVAYLVHHWDDMPRMHEMLEGLWTVGLRNYPHIGIFDSHDAPSYEAAIDLYGYENVLEYHVELLRRFKPKVALGHDLNGEYGNGTHMLNAQALLKAVENAADSTYHVESYEKYGTWDTPKLYLHLYWISTITMNWDFALPNFDGATAIEVAAIGLDCYRSLQDFGYSVPRIGPSGHVFGLARSTVGEDRIGGDMFENIYQ